MLSILQSGAIVAALISSTASALDLSSHSNVITYWGSGANQDRLLETCKNSAVDIINVGFLNVFPDQGPGGWPGLNLGNACWAPFLSHNGVVTDIPSSCPNMTADIQACQQTYGKKILLSLGGAYPNNQYIKSASSAQAFAEYLWKYFGPVTSGVNMTERPFREAVVDGFDFDIESDASQLPSKSYLDSNYATMVNYLRSTVFPRDRSKTYYISAAPQCPLPDAHLSSVIQDSSFDWVSIQFYNNPACSAINAIDHKLGPDINFDAWTKAASKNTGAKLFIGLPASTDSAGSGYYLTQAQAQKVVERFQSNSRFGGVMLWEATSAARNLMCGDNYLTWMKRILVGGSSVVVDPNHCPATTTTTRPITTTRKTTTTTHKTTTTTHKPVTKTTVKTLLKTTTSTKPATTTSITKATTKQTTSTSTKASPTTSVKTTSTTSVKTTSTTSVKTTSTTILKVTTATSVKTSSTTIVKITSSTSTMVIPTTTSKVSVPADTPSDADNNVVHQSSSSFSVSFSYSSSASSSSSPASSSSASSSSSAGSSTVSSVSTSSSSASSSFAASSTCTETDATSTSSSAASTYSSSTSSSPFGSSSSSSYPVSSSSAISSEDVSTTCTKGESTSTSSSTASSYPGGYSSASTSQTSTGPVSSYVAGSSASSVPMSSAVTTTCTESEGTSSLEATSVPTSSTPVTYPGQSSVATSSPSGGAGYGYSVTDVTTVYTTECSATSTLTNAGVVTTSTYATTSVVTEVYRTTVPVASTYPVSGMITSTTPCSSSAPTSAGASGGYESSAPYYGAGKGEVDSTTVIYETSYVVPVPSASGYPTGGAGGSSAPAYTGGASVVTTSFALIAVAALLGAINL